LNNNPKILLASPINVVKSYVLYDWLKYIKQLDYDNYDIFLVDNSPGVQFTTAIRNMGFDCEHEWREGREARYYMAASNERIRIKFLSGEYSHLFSLECDIFPPKDIIQRLLAHDKDVVGTTYWTGHGYDTFMQLFTLYCQHTDYVSHSKIFKTRVFTFEEAQLFMDGQLKTAYANGVGCIMIKRWVLEMIKFRVDPSDTGYADSFFHRDLWENGIENFVDTSIIPQHRNSNWNTILDDTGHKKMAVKTGVMNLKPL